MGRAVLVVVAGAYFVLWLGACRMYRPENPMRTPGDHVAKGLETATMVGVMAVAIVPAAVLYGIVSLSQEIGDALRSDNGRPSLAAPKEPREDPDELCGEARPVAQPAPPRPLDPEAPPAGDLPPLDLDVPQPAQPTPPSNR